MNKTKQNINKTKPNKKLTKNRKKTKTKNKSNTNKQKYLKTKISRKKIYLNTIFITYIAEYSNSP